jgi:hypothetical protein
MEKTEVGTSDAMLEPAVTMEGSQQELQELQEDMGMDGSESIDTDPNDNERYASWTH